MKNKTFIILLMIACLGLTSTTFAARSLIGKEDLHMWDGVSGDTSYTRTSSGGYSLTLHDITWVGVDVLHEYGASVNQNSTTLQAALTAVGTSHNVAFWMAPGDWSMTSGVTVPDNIAFVLPMGCNFAISSGATLTVNGPLKAGEYRVATLTDRDTFIYGGPSKFNVKWTGATGDNSTDDSNAFNDAIGALSAGAKLVIPDGVYLINSVDFDVSDLTIECLGQLKPYANSGYVVKVGHDTVQKYRIRGNLYVDSDSNHVTYDTVDAIQIVNLNDSNLHLQGVGCEYGIYMIGNNSKGSAYNQITLGQVLDNKYNVYLDAVGSGWCNENVFYGGRFTWNAGVGSASCCHITIAYDATHNPNNNRFYAPSLEGSTGQYINIGGQYNKIVDFRLENAGTWQSDLINFGSNSARNEISTSYDSGFTGNMVTLVSSGVTVARSNDTVFTLTLAATDLTSQLFPGQICMVTVGGTDYYVPVYVSTYAANVTTVRVTLPVITATPTEVEVLPITNAGRTNRILLSKVDYPGVSNLKYVLDHETAKFHHGGLFLRGLSDDFPALVLLPGNSASDDILSGFGFTQKTLSVTGDGDITTLGDVKSEDADSGSQCKLMSGTSNVEVDGASTSWAGIPDGVIVLGVQTYVTDTITNASGYTVGDGSDADRWGDKTGTAIGTKTVSNDFTASGVSIFTSATNIVLTAKTANFTGGTIRVIVHYFNFGDPSN